MALFVVVKGKQPTIADKFKRTVALFIRLIIYLFQLVFLAVIVFFSHNKSANSVFQPAYQHSRMAPVLLVVALLRPCLDAQKEAKIFA
jgi:hypothetical protein